MIVLDGRSLTVAQIADLADARQSAVVAPEARAAIEASHRHAGRVSAERSVYGRTTGVGANREHAVTDTAAHAGALIRSHASSAGPLRSRRRVRAMLAVRLNQLAAGGSGVRPEVADAVAQALADDRLPAVREYGSVGTGDLPALATTALALPVRCTVHDALPFLSSNAATIADAALASAALDVLARATVPVAALTLQVVDGNVEAFSPAAERATPFDGAREVCRAMRALAGTSQRAGTPPTPARIQDPFGLRTLPQVHGTLLDALRRLDETVRRMANAPAENPLMLPGEPVIHHGGFQAAYLGQALDAVRSALAESAHLIPARLALLLDPDYTRLPAFLGDGTPAASGLMMTEYVAASALAEVRALAAAPAGGRSVTLSRGVEDASFAPLAARQALDAASPYRTALACELLAATRGLRMRGLAAPAACAVLSADPADRDLTDDLLVAEQILDRLPRPDALSGRSAPTAEPRPGPQQVEDEQHDADDQQIEEGVDDDANDPQRHANQDDEQEQGHGGLLG